MGLRRRWRIAKNVWQTGRHRSRKCTLRFFLRHLSLVNRPARINHGAYTNDRKCVNERIRDLSHNKPSLLRNLMAAAAALRSEKYWAFLKVPAPQTMPQPRADFASGY
jgi:hypothetical protein